MAARTLVRARRRDSRGSNAVEFALVVPLLLALLFGIVTAGFAFSQRISLNESVREGARYGATSLARQAPCSPDTYRIGQART